LVAALDTLDARPSAAVFIGDSATDIEAAEGAAMRCVAFANKAGKRELFETNAAVVIDSMWELHAAFSARR
jgi:phosphoglycolate phosphatase-like HAD superfamily hydrolase